MGVSDSYNSVSSGGMMVGQKSEFIRFPSAARSRGAGGPGAEDFGETKQDTGE